MLTKISSVAVAAVLFAGGAIAAPLSSGWVAGANVEGGSAFGPTSIAGANVGFTGNSDRTAINTANPASGNFVYSGKLQSTGGDNDTLGAIFGYVDGANNYRLGWEGGGDWDSENGPFNGTGNNGLWLISETAGVTTSLFANTSLFWAKNVIYDWSISINGGNISFSVSQGGSVLESQTVAANRSTDGLVGVYANSQSGVFQDLDLSAAQVSAVPLPASSLLLMGALGGVAAAARRKARKA